MWFRKNVKIAAAYITFVFVISIIIYLIYKSGLRLGLGKEYLNWNPTKVIFEMILYLSIFTLLIYVGLAIKKIFGFQYISTGIVTFFSITFTINLILCIYDISSVAIENSILFSLTTFLIGYIFFSITGRIKSILFLISIIFCMVTVTVMPENIFVTREPILDEIPFLYPVTKWYDEHGFCYTFQRNPTMGYGLFGPHVWTIIKRLLTHNPHASYYFMSKVVTFLGILFILELRLKKTAAFIVSFHFLATLYIDKWLYFLFSNSLYSEGITGYFFASVLREASTRDTYYLNFALNI